MSRSVGLVGVGLGWLELNARFWRPNLDVPKTFIMLFVGAYVWLHSCLWLLHSLLCVVRCPLSKKSGMLMLSKKQSHSGRTHII